MLFKELSINQKFKIVNPNNVTFYIRLADFNGNCCNKPYNCAILTQDLTKQVRRLKLDENTEVEIL